MIGNRKKTWFRFAAVAGFVAFGWTLLAPPVRGQGPSGTVPQYTPAAELTK
jgi:hypothetical protein